MISDNVCEVNGTNSDSLLDSGACVCVAPKDFAKHTELVKMTTEPELYSATGKRLRVYGERLFPFLVKTVDERSLAVRVLFVVADVRRPLISVASLTDQGFEVNFVCLSSITNKESGTEVIMERRGNGFFLPAVLQTVTSDKVLHHRAGQLGDLELDRAPRCVRV